MHETYVLFGMASRGVAWHGMACMYVYMYLCIICTVIVMGFLSQLMKVTSLSLPSGKSLHNLWKIAILYGSNNYFYGHGFHSYDITRGYIVSFTFRHGHPPGLSQWPFQDPIDWRYLPYIRPIFQA